MRDHKKENEILINLLKDGTQYENIISVFDYFSYLADTNTVSKSKNNVNIIPLEEKYLDTTETEIDLDVVKFDNRRFISDNATEFKFKFGESTISVNISNALGLQTTNSWINREDGTSTIISAFKSDTDYLIYYPKKYLIINIDFIQMLITIIML